MRLRPAPAFLRYGLAVAVGVAVARWKGWIPGEGAGRARLEEVGRPATRVEGAWEELVGCRLVNERGNDGDSFVVEHQGRRYTVRLYFVDCPEKVRHQYNGDRLADQGRYFGGLSEGETVGVGEAARDFSLERLRAGGFAVLTRWEAVFDSERYYAFVGVPQGDLGELLVREGLARIYTKGENRPRGLRAAAEKQRLRDLEGAARRARRGGWGLR